MLYYKKLFYFDVEVLEFQVVVIGSCCTLRVDFFPFSPYRFPTVYNLCKLKNLALTIELKAEDYS